jgi:hypothetical protein
MKRAAIAAVFMAACCLNAFAETGIAQVIRVLEQKYSVHHHGIPGLWLAKPFMIGSGVSGLKMATFGDLRVPSAGMHELKQQMRQALGPQWQPFVETYSARSGEWTAIYLQPSGKAMQMLIATGEHNEFTVMKMKLSEKAMRDWIDEPVKHSHHSAIRSSHDSKP